jgi:methanogenic corrinoid protein MtbC1
MLDKLAEAVIEGETDYAEALAKGLDPLQCITEGLIKGIQKVGELFASGECFCADGYAEEAISAIDIAFRLIDAPV